MENGAGRAGDGALSDRMARDALTGFFRDRWPAPGVHLLVCHGIKVPFGYGPTTFGPSGAAWGGHGVVYCCCPSAGGVGLARILVCDSALCALAPASARWSQMMCRNSDGVDVGSFVERESSLGDFPQSTLSAGTNADQ